jgi:hypothetical protein
MRTQLTDLKKELAQIEYTLNSNRANSPNWKSDYYLPEKTVEKLLKRKEIVRSIIFNIQ